jgi:hypothetical protein
LSNPAPKAQTPEVRIQVLRARYENLVAECVLLLEIETIQETDPPLPLSLPLVTRRKYTGAGAELISHSVQRMSRHLNAVNRIRVEAVRYQQIVATVTHALPEDLHRAAVSDTLLVPIIGGRVMKVQAKGPDLECNVSRLFLCRANGTK